MMIAYWTNSNSWTSEKKKQKKIERKKKETKKKRKKERERKKEKKKETVAKKKKKVAKILKKKKSGCLIFENEIEAFRGVFFERKSWNKSPYLDSPLNSERFDI